MPPQQKKEIVNPRSRWLGFFLALLAGIFALQYQAASSAFAQVLINFSKNNLQLLRQPFRDSSDYDVRIQEDLEMALLWQPKNAEIQDGLGRYSLFRIKSQTELMSPSLNGAETYQKAISMRPSKADLWRRLAYIKALSGQFDEEFYLAYQRAFDYGGWDYHINHTLMRIGFAHWGSMSVDSRPIFKQIVIRSYGVKPYSVLQLAQQYGELRMVCSWVHDEKLPHRICEKELSE